MTEKVIWIIHLAQKNQNVNDENSSTLIGEEELSFEVFDHSGGVLPS